jgi:methylenetetrahydrofolate reductase (NADPH)
MAYRQEEMVAQIIEEAGLLPRPMRPGIPPDPHEHDHHKRSKQAA